MENLSLIIFILVFGVIALGVSFFFFWLAYRNIIKEIKKKDE